MKYFNLIITLLILIIIISSSDGLLNDWYFVILLIYSLFSNGLFAVFEGKKEIKPRVFMAYELKMAIEDTTKDGCPFIRRVNSNEVFFSFYNDYPQKLFIEWWEKEGIYSYSKVIENKSNEALKRPLIDGFEIPPPPPIKKKG